jgi:hypothetical protein
MAIAHGSIVQDTEQSQVGDSGTDSWHTVPGTSISSSNFDPAGKYLVICTAQCRGSATSVDFGFRLKSTSGNWNGGGMYFRPRLATAGYTTAYSFIALFEPNEGDGLLCEFRNLALTNSQNYTVYADSIVIAWMRLDQDLVENVDWFYALNSSSTVATHPTYTNKQSITFTPPVAGEKWLVMSGGNFNLNAGTTFSLFHRLVSSGGGMSTELVPEVQYEPEASNADWAEEIPTLISRVFTPSNSSTTFTHSVSKEGGTGTFNVGRMIILNISKFTSCAHFWDASDTANLSTSVFDEIANVDVSTSSTQDLFILGHSVYRATSSNDFAFGQLTVNGTVTPTGVDLNRQIGAHDSTDNMSSSLLAMPNLAAGTQDIDMDGKAHSSDVIAVGHRSLVAFTMELDSAQATLGGTATLDVTGGFGQEARVTLRGKGTLQIPRGVSVYVGQVAVSGSGTLYSPIPTVIGPPALYTVTRVGADMRASLVLQKIGNGGICLILRYVDASNYWRLYVEQTTLDILLQKVVSGTPTSVAGPFTAAEDGIGLEMTAYGNVISGQAVSLATTEVFAVVDSAHNSATKCGLSIEANSTSRLDEFHAWDISGVTEDFAAQPGHTFWGGPEVWS